MTLLIGKLITSLDSVMARQRSILSLILVFLATVLIGCGGPSVATPPPTYTESQIQQIQEYIPEIETVRDRATELQKLVEKKEWVKVGNFIHGPMAEARLTMNYIVPNLLPNDQPAARKVSRELFDHLVKIDQAASAGNQRVALNNTAAVFSDIDEFLQLLPKA